MDGITNFALENPFEFAWETICFFTSFCSSLPPKFHLDSLVRNSPSYGTDNKSRNHPNNNSSERWNFTPRISLRSPRRRLTCEDLTHRLSHLFNTYENCQFPSSFWYKISYFCTIGASNFDCLQEAVVNSLTKCNRIEHRYAT